MEKGISAIICAYTEQRWNELLSAVKSVRLQTLPANEIIVVIDHNPALLGMVQSHLPDVIAIENIQARGLSGARNSGILKAQYSMIAFLDDDARATPCWLQLLYEGLADSQALGIGGAVLPVWPETRVSWFPEEFLWVIGCTYRGMPQDEARIRNPIGANMAFRREVFDEVGGFLGEIGRVGMLPVGCEETELCIRARQYWPEGYFLYQPEAKVFHCIAPGRLTWRYFCARCYGEGLSKARVSRYVGVESTLSSELTYTCKTLPCGVLHGLSDALLRGDLSGLARSFAICLGLLITTLGYLVGTLSSQGSISAGATMYLKAGSVPAKNSLSEQCVERTEATNTISK